MIKIRLARGGRIHKPVYTIVAADARCPRDGRFLEKLGQYNPSNEEQPLTDVKVDEMKTWIGKGAILTDISVRIAPLPIHVFISSTLTSVKGCSSLLGLYCPSFSRKRPSLGHLASAATIVYTGLWILPPRAKRILIISTPTITVSTSVN